jgi:hypothetical protein
MHRFLLIWIFLTAGIVQDLPAVIQDTEVNSSEVVRFIRQMFFDPFAGESIVDTTLTGAQLYDLHDRRSPFYAGKGNVGHVNRSMTFEPDLQPHFVLFPEPYYRGYILSTDNQVFYRPKHVFSELFYVTGSAREQLFYAMHNQRLAESIYLGLKYQTVNSPGVYSRLSSRNAGLEVKLDAELGDRYGLLGSFELNRLVNWESGGLKNHLNFEEDEVRDSVFLYSAESRYRDIGFSIQQFYRAAITRVVSKNDTLHRTDEFSLGVFRHEFSYKRRAFLFDEAVAPSPVFYGVPPMNINLTYDSTLVHTISNKLSWSNHLSQSINRSLPLHLMLYAEHKFVNMRQPLFYEQPVNEEYDFAKDEFRQFSYGARIQSDPEYFLSFIGFANYIMGGYNDGDHDIGGKLSIGRHENNLHLSFKGHYSEQEAPYFLNHFRGNYIYWNNDFFKQRTMNLGMSLKSLYVKLEANYYFLDRAVFINADAFPEQHAGSFSVFTTGLSSDVDVWFLRSHHKIVYQYTGEEQYHRYPSLISYHSLYADFKLFDNALHAHTGFDLRYNAPYRPMAYMPVVRQFYIQDDYESDHVYFLDAFVNAKISRVRMFVKVQNVLGLFLDAPKYYEIPFYPMPEGMFKFGVSWMFFD